MVTTQTNIMGWGHGHIYLKYLKSEAWKRIQMADQIKCPTDECCSMLVRWLVAGVSGPVYVAAVCGVVQ